MPRVRTKIDDAGDYPGSTLYLDSWNEYDAAEVHLEYDPQSPYDRATEIYFSINRSDALRLARRLHEWARSDR